MLKVTRALDQTCHCFGPTGFVLILACATGCVSSGGSTPTANTCTANGSCPGGGSPGTVGGTSSNGGTPETGGSSAAVNSSGGSGTTSGSAGNASGGSSATGGSSPSATGGITSGHSGGSSGAAGSSAIAGSGASVGGSSTGGSSAKAGTGGGNTGGSSGGAASGTGGSATGGASAKGGTNGTGGGATGGAAATGGSTSVGGRSSSGTVSCAGYPVWNSQVTYNTAGELVEYNCKLYQDQGFAYDVNPETRNGQYYEWLLVGSCSESDCAMGEGPWIACGNYDKWATGAYEVYNDVWGSGAGTQCITAWDGSHFTVNSTQPATSGVKSYPNSGFVNVNKTIGSLKTFASSFDITVPSSGDWEATYDIWVPSEIMIWMYTQGNVGPIATAWDSSGKPIPSATDVTVGGHTWNVYHQSGGNNVISFVRTTNTTAATVDILALINWAITQGWIADGTIGATQFGFEISGTDNVATDFTCNSFSMTIN